MNRFFTSWFWVLCFFGFEAAAADPFEYLSVPIPGRGTLRVPFQRALATAGNAERKVMVLAPGLGMNARSLEHLARSYRETGFDVYFVERRATSTTSVLSPLSQVVDDFALATQQIARQCPSCEMTLGGYSLGGMVALQTASRTNFATEVPQVRQLLLLNSADNMDRLPFQSLMRRGIPGSLGTLTIPGGSGRGAMLSTLTGRPRLSDRQAVEALARDGFGEFDLPLIRDLLASMGREGPLPGVRPETIRLPVRIVSSGGDVLVTPRRVEEFRSRLVNAASVEHLVLPELNHVDLLTLGHEQGLHRTAVASVPPGAPTQLGSEVVEESLLHRCVQRALQRALLDR